MPASEYSSEKTRNKKRAIGAIAIMLLLFFTVLAFLGYIPFIIWIVADLVVAGIANLLLRRVGRVIL
jgi:cell division septal protein FtsQ